MSQLSEDVILVEPRITLPNWNVFEKQKTDVIWFVILARPSRVSLSQDWRQIWLILELMQKNTWGTFQKWASRPVGVNVPFVLVLNSNFRYVFFSYNKWRTGCTTAAPEAQTTSLYNMETLYLCTKYDLNYISTFILIVIPFTRHMAVAKKNYGHSLNLKQHWGHSLYSFK